MPYHSLMDSLPLHEFHETFNGVFFDFNGKEAVAHYGDPVAEHLSLSQAAGVLDLSFRGRLCLLGTDRQKFLNGQVTNNVKDLKTGQGCYAALITAKGKMQSDLNIYALENELLLDFEPGLSDAVKDRLDKYIISDDAQIVDVAPHYSLLSIQGPKAVAVIQSLELGFEIPEARMTLTKIKNDMLGELYLVNLPRTGAIGFDLFVPTPAAPAVADKLIASAKDAGGGPCGWQALELARIEAGIPRFGADMDETNLPPEAGLDKIAISYSKGCYIGQEVIARIRTYGQVAKSLRGIRLAYDLKKLPVKGDKLFLGEKEIGFVTSATASSKLKGNIALGYIRREANQTGTELVLQTTEEKTPAKIVELPFTN